MKNVKVLMFVFLAGSLGMTACKKKGCTDAEAVNYNEKAKKDDGTCNYKPVITIVGNNPATIGVGETYNDAGATANTKGVTVTVNSDLTAVNTSAVGSFDVKYTASNEHGTTTATRKVNVVLKQSSYLGAYTATNDCSSAFPLAANATVAAGSSANEVIIQSAFQLVGGEILLLIDGNNITIPFQSVNITVGTIEISGSGTMNNTGTEMVLNFDYNNSTPFLGEVGSCSATYTK
jgi:hypothetical protein